MADEETDVGKAISAIISVLKPLEAGAQVDVLEFVIKHLQITLTSVKPAFAAPTFFDAEQASVAIQQAAPSQQAVVDIRDLARRKKPQTVNEKVTLVAYYLQHVAPQDQRRDSITSEDLHPNFIQADFEMPNTTPSMMLSNARNAGYLNVVDRGRYQLNPVGYNLVAHKLPVSEDAPKKKASARKARKPAKAKRATPKR